MKLAVFHPKARDAIQAFPEEVRREFGKVIFDLQKGEKPRCSCRERCLRLRQALRNCASGNARREIALAQKRLKEMVDEES
jgi:phage-related protein